MIRASLFRKLKKELPYCCEVRITEFKEPKPGAEKPLIRIKANVVVERDSQKLIVIGKGGEQIKSIGIEARENLQEFFQTQVSFTVLGPYVIRIWFLCKLSAGGCVGLDTALTFCLALLEFW